jgi:hypothetical protein
MHTFLPTSLPLYLPKYFIPSYLGDKWAGFPENVLLLAASQKSACGKLASSPFPEAGIECLLLAILSQKLLREVQIFAFTYLYRLLWAPVIILRVGFVWRSVLLSVWRRGACFSSGVEQRTHARTHARTLSIYRKWSLLVITAIIMFGERNASLVFVRLIRSLRLWLLFLACSRQGFCVLRWKLV